MQDQAVNVQCEKCGKWGYVEFYHQTETGYQCNDCDEEVRCEMEITLNYDKQKHL